MRQDGTDEVWTFGETPFVLGMPLKRVELLLEMAQEHSELGYPLTVMLMPLTGSDSSTWGGYSMPNMESPLHKRQAEKPLSETFEEASQAVKAAPMSTPCRTSKGVTRV